MPSVAFEPRFQGAFRNLEYSSEGTRPEKQEMMAYKVCKNIPFTFIWCMNLFKPFGFKDKILGYSGVRA